MSNARITDVPVEVLARIVGMSDSPAEASSACRALRDACKLASGFGTIRARRPWAGDGPSVISRARTVTVMADDEISSMDFVEWMRTRPQRGFDGVEEVRATMHPDGFRPITTLSGFARAFPKAKRIKLESSASFEAPKELVFPSIGLENLEELEVVVAENSNAWIEIFAGFPRPAKLRSVHVRSSI